jgi:DNA repair protein RecO (recombination protein O)
MALSRDRCVCLRKVEYSETSQILTLFGREHGILRLIAKGAHRRTKAGASKFDGGVDLLDVGEAVFTHAPERDLSPLCEWHLVEGHLALRKNLRAVYLGLYAVELVSMLIEEHDAHPELFDRLEHTLTALATAQLEEAFLVFELDLLRETGYVPQLAACFSCRAGFDRAEHAYFSPNRSAVVCRNCETTAPDRIEIDARLLRLLQSILHLPRDASGAIQRLPRLSRHQTDPINRILAEHVEQVLSRRLRMPPYVLAQTPSDGAPRSAARVAQTPARAL